MSLVIQLVLLQLWAGQPSKEREGQDQEGQLTVLAWNQNRNETKALQNTNTQLRGQLFRV